MLPLIKADFSDLVVGDHLEYTFIVNSLCASLKIVRCKMRFAHTWNADWHENKYSFFVGHLRLLFCFNFCFDFSFFLFVLDFWLNRLSLNFYRFCIFFRLLVLILACFLSFHLLFCGLLRFRCGFSDVKSMHEVFVTSKSGLNSYFWHTARCIF